ncbi:hypothetical protein [Variovorax rhizosphaerae]|uniref:Uncharacterized protein n=1 Tax=Variovorax rhizosphaerae TaxID=1836200 RepID=A0ABU8WWJ3_9BURK
MGTKGASQLYAKAILAALNEVPTSEEIAGLEYRHVAFAVYCMRRGRGEGMPYLERYLEPLIEADETDAAYAGYQWIRSCFGEDA